MQRSTTVSNSLRKDRSRENGRGGSWKTSNDRDIAVEPQATEME